MKSHLLKPKYLVRFQKQSPERWDGHSPLCLGHPIRYVIENKEGKLRVRDFTHSVNEIHALKTFPLESLLGGAVVPLSDFDEKDTLGIKELKEMTAFNPAMVPAQSSVVIDTPILVAIEDILFKKHIQKVAGAMAFLFLAVLGSQLFEPKVNTNEELIPQKYAKLILTKPKENLKTPASGGSTQSQAQVKAIARAFQSKTVQSSLKNILRGGISKYSIMATGRSITSLSQKISGQTDVMGAGLQNKASDLLAGANVGKYQIGSDSGYGSGNGVNVKGQGNGQLEIGLNTQDATVDEGLTKDEVARVIHSHMNEIRYCYESAILKDPTIAGKLLVDFKINASGIVPNAGVAEASLHDLQVTQCLLGKLKSWKFPQPRGGVVVAVSYPFIFKSLSR